MKKIFVLIMLVLAVTVLIGCESDTNTTTPKVSVSSTPPHTHAFGEWMTVKESTCTDEGEEERICECGETEKKRLDVIEHVYVSSVVAPTCTEGGYTENVCACGKSYNTDKTSKLGHDYGEWTVDIPSTCQVNGVEVSKCKNCDDERVRLIDLSEHSYLEWTVMLAPTCTDKGKETSVCSYDGCELRSNRDINALGGSHVMSEWQTTTEPTCTAKGEKVRSCTKEGCGKTETVQLDEKHTLGEWITVEESTCIKAGTSKRSCAKCEYFETKALELLEHTYGNWQTLNAQDEQRKCTFCSDTVIRKRITSAKNATVEAAYAIKNKDYVAFSTVYPYRRQGGCVANGCAYQVLITKNEETACIMKLDSKTGKTTYSEYRPMGHGNDMTYNADTNCVYVASGGTTLYVYDADTLEYKGTFKIGGNASGISYNAFNDSWVGLAGGNVSFYDVNGKRTGGFSPTERGETQQGLCTDEDYIYVLYCTGFGSSRYHCYVYIYDYSGNHINTVTVSIPSYFEPENISVIDGVLYIGACSTQPVVTFYKVIAR